MGYAIMSISERLKQVINEKGLNIKGFSEATAIPYRSVQNYLLEDRDPNVESLSKMAASMNINLHWLITGEGKMFIDNIESGRLNDEEIKLLLAFKQCDEQSQRNISVAVNAIASDLVKNK